MPPRLLSLFARRPGIADGPPVDGPPGDPVPPVTAEVDGAPSPPPRPSALRRELRALIRQRETELRDIGGLALEMVRRDRFRHDLLIARCADVVGLEQRIQELDSFLAAAEIAPRSVRGAYSCKCGAPIVRGAHFCSHCGRPAIDTPPVVACAHCGQPLPAEANFCSVCGNPVGDEFAPEQGAEATMVAGPERDEERG